MIKSNYGHTEISGSSDVVLAELSCIIQALMESGKIPKEK